MSSLWHCGLNCSPYKYFHQPSCQYLSYCRAPKKPFSFELLSTFRRFLPPVFFYERLAPLIHTWKIWRNLQPLSTRLLNFLLSASQNSQVKSSGTFLDFAFAVLIFCGRGIILFNSFPAISSSSLVLYLFIETSSGILLRRLIVRLSRKIITSFPFSY